MITDDVRSTTIFLAGTSNENAATTSNVARFNHEDINQHVAGNGNLRPTKDISAWTFPMDFSLTEWITSRSSLGPVVEASGVAANMMKPEGESEEIGGAVSTSMMWHTTNITQEERESVSRRVNAETATLVAARETRVKERLAVNDRTGTRVRLVAGCVPILQDGRVVLIGSRKGNDWVGLPKGGWELDETLEEAAIRECFEEAGVLGILGPNLPSFLIESGKAKGKRQDAEKVPSSDFRGPVSTGDGAKGVNYCELNTLTPLWDTLSNGERKGRELKESEGYPRTHTCMTFFPLYVQQVKEIWPESSRTRTAFPIEGT